MTNDQAWEAVHAVYDLVSWWERNEDPDSQTDIDTLNQVLAIVAPLVEEEQEGDCEEASNRAH